MANRLSNRAASGAKAAIINGASWAIPNDKRISVEWTLEVGAKQAGTAGDRRVMIVGVDATAVATYGVDADSAYVVGHAYDQGCVVVRRNAGAFDSGANTYAAFAETVLGADPAFATLAPGAYAFKFTFDPSDGFYELTVNGAVSITGADPAKLSLNGKRVLPYMNNTSGTALNAQNYGFAGDIALKSYTFVPDNPLTIGCDPLDGAAITLNGSPVMTPTSPVYPDSGESQTVVAPALFGGRVFSHWTLNGVQATTNRTYTFTALSSPMALRAVYIRKPRATARVVGA